MVPVMLATYVLPYTCTFGIINLCFYCSHAWILLYSYTYTKCVLKVNKLVFKTKILNLKSSRD